VASVTLSFLTISSKVYSSEVNILAITSLTFLSAYSLNVSTPSMVSSLSDFTLTAW